MSTGSSVDDFVLQHAAMTDRLQLITRKIRNYGKASVRAFHIHGGMFLIYYTKNCFDEVDILEIPASIVAIEDQRKMYEAWEEYRNQEPPCETKSPPSSIV